MSGVLMSDPENIPLHRTPLYALHLACGARMVGFAGYEMPVQYTDGIISEHLHTRMAAGLFDVSHMGQALLSGPAAATLIETLVPGDIAGLRQGRMRYTQLLNAHGGIIDDLMVTRLSEEGAARDVLFLVVNAGTKMGDFSHIRHHLPKLDLHVLEHHGLIAVQGPRAVDAVEQLFPGASEMPFLSMQSVFVVGTEVRLSRCGYTGEDGFEISAPSGLLPSLAEKLLAFDWVKPIGLGARDSLRLEAGLCLYGHDMDINTTPIEASLGWSIGKRRQLEGGFPGDERVRLQLAHGADHVRVGLMLAGRAPAREGSDIQTPEGVPVGQVTSGGFSPSLGRPIAMGRVARAHAAPGTALQIIVRNKALEARIVPMPFVPTHYFRSAQ